jgi:hypothetical protein
MNEAVTSSINAAWSWLRQPSLRERILERLAGRTPLPKSELFQTYWRHAGVPEPEVIAALDLIELEFAVDAGLLRPSDPLDLLFSPPATRHPLRWMEFHTACGDRQAEFSRQLSKRLRRHGTIAYWPRVITVDEFIRAWGGLLP